MSNAPIEVSQRVRVVRYAISYVSTAKSSLSQEDVAALFEQVNEFNNSHNITGVLLYAETNFFQLLEGEEKMVKDLYSQIEKDSRHHDIIKFVEKPVILPAYDGYISRFVTDTTKLNKHNLERYLHQIEVLDPDARKAVERVIESIAG